MFVILRAMFVILRAMLVILRAMFVILRERKRPKEQVSHGNLHREE